MNCGVSLIDLIVERSMKANLTRTLQEHYLKAAMEPTGRKDLLLIRNMLL